MEEKKAKRKLTAILSADVKGYSRLMQDDEEATVRTIKAYREVMTNLIQGHDGRVVDAKGDNVLAEFPSVVDAVRCTVEVQKEVKARNAELPYHRKMEFRIGVNLGDVIEEGETIYGDGVNVAARLEGLADSGGLCISGTTFDQVRDKLNLGYEYLGEQSVKNIPRPVRAYKVLMEPKYARKLIGEERPKPKQRRWAAVASAVVIIVAAGAFAIWNFYFRPPPMEVASVEKMAFPLPDKPSIAVLPFVNMSGDPEQEYFSDGLTEEIITALSKVPKLFVIARNSSFTYKGKPVKVQQVSEDLGVRYVLEGSVRKAGNRVRITAQLIDAITGYHVWSERYDRDLKDIFALQDQITLEIIASLQAELTERELSRLAARGTKNLQAYLKCIQGKEIYLRITKENNALSRKIFEDVIVLDPQYAAAYQLLGGTYWMDVFYGSSKSPKKSIAKAMELNQKAIALDNSYGPAHGSLGWLYTLTGKHEKGISEIDRAIELAPNDANAHMWMSYVLRVAGRNEEAIRYSERAVRLNPIPPSWYFRGLALNYLYAGRYDEAITACKKGLNSAPNDFMTHVTCAAAYSQAGREGTARVEAEEVLRINPKFSIVSYAKRLPYKNKEDRDFFINALRKAGLPETPPLPLPDKPSIAVLAFTNMSGDPEQELFSDGIAEQIITSLSKVSDLFVIARTSSFRYKGKEVDVRKIGKELGVRYVLEGSVQRSGDRLRVNAQLIEANTGHHLWAEKYDRDLKDIFALQDEITKRIITSLHLKLTMGDDARVFGQNTDSLEAYLKFLEGNKLYLRFNKDTNILARQMFKEAIALDPNYVSAYNNLAWTHLLDAAYGWTKSRAKSLEAAYEFAQKALSLDDSQPGAYGALSSVHLQKGEIREAVALREKAVALGPNSANHHNLLGIALLFMGGRTEEALNEMKIANRLDPFPPNHILHYLGVAYRVNGEYEKAIETFKKVIKRNPDFWLSHLGLAACYGLLGHEEEARAAAAEVLRIRPNFSIVKVMTPYRDKADKERTLEVLRKAELK